MSKIAAAKSETLTPSRKSPGVPESVHQVLESPGQPLDAQTRGLLEPRFGRDFSAIRVHADARAARSAADVGALAYTVGRDVVFGSGHFTPSSPGGLSLLAHELTHAVQQSQSAAGDGPLAIGHPSDATESVADDVAHAVAHRSALPPIRGGQPRVLRRFVDTFGGRFDTSTYTAINDATGAAPDGVGKIVGCQILLKFTPNDLVEAPANGIGMTQTVQTFRNAAAGGNVDVPANARTVPDALVAGEGDIGRGIDRVDFSPEAGSTLPTTNPLYGVHNTAADPAAGTAASVSTSLTDTAPGGTASFGSHVRKADGTFNAAVDATLRDRPRRQINFAGQIWQQQFETTALVLRGPMTNTYLGSVRWGWQTDAAGNATLNPPAITRINAGLPSLGFMQAANKWNNLQFTDTGTGTVHDTVDLPTIDNPFDSGTTLPSARTTQNLLLWLDLIKSQIDGLPNPSVERTNKEFERRALEAELLTRQIALKVKVVKTEDTFGADEVYAKLKAGPRALRSRVQDLKNGQETTFTFALKNLMPIEGPIRVEVYDEDVNDDDLIVVMDWTSPFGPIINTRSRSGADYRVDVRFDR